MSFIVDTPIYQSHPNINVSADDLTLMKQVQSGVEPIIGELYKDNRLSKINFHVTTGVCIVEGWHKDGSNAKTAIGTGLVSTTDPEILSRAVVDRLLRNMGKPIVVSGKNRQYIGDLWLPN